VLQFNDLVKDVTEKRVTVSDAVNRIAVSIQTDYKVFGLAKYDEDLRASVVLDFLKTGYKLFDRYNENYGSFFNYLQSYIRGLTQTRIKKFAVENAKTQVEILHCEENYNEEVEKHAFSLCTEQKNYVQIPNKPVKKGKTPLTLKEFMQKRIIDQGAKPAVVIALRSCYDLSDTIINNICESYNIDKDDFFKNVQELKDLQYPKYCRHIEYENSRNEAFFMHRRYSPSMADYENSTEALKAQFMERYKNSTDLWNKKNRNLEKGRYHYNPTNAVLAERLGVCTRQISYYIAKARTLMKTEDGQVS